MGGEVENAGELGGWKISRCCIVVCRGCAVWVEKKGGMGPPQRKHE